jgi:hypothetical protein
MTGSMYIKLQIELSMSCRKKNGKFPFSKRVYPKHDMGAEYRKGREENVI